MAYAAHVFKLPVTRAWDKATALSGQSIAACIRYHDSKQQRNADKRDSRNQPSGPINADAPIGAAAAAQNAKVTLGTRFLDIRGGNLKSRVF